MSHKYPKKLHPRNTSLGQTLRPSLFCIPKENIPKTKRSLENLRQRLGFHSLFGGQPLGFGVRVTGEASRTGRGGAGHSPLRRAGMREPDPASCSLCW